jgi:hypothetical protein
MKKVSRWLKARDLGASIAGYLVVLGILVAFDERVGRQLRLLFSRGPDLGGAGFGDRLGDLGHALLAAARDQSIDHAPMLVFTAVAIVLVFVMVRT